jgi:hypothetical protein
VSKSVWLRSWSLVATLVLAAGCTQSEPFEPSQLSQLSTGADYEVWLTDQNNTAGFSSSAPRGTHGGRLLIYSSAQLEAAGGPAGAAPEVIDLAQLFAVGGPYNPTGARVVRPHMALPSPDHRFMALAFVASGHVAIFDARTRTPRGLFRMSPGFGGNRQAHAAYWLPDGSGVLVANQNGKLLERIGYDGATETFFHDTAATLNLATCVTPSGHPCESFSPVSDLDPGFLGEHNRPDNAPICPIVTSSGSAFITLRGGGLFVVDARATPLQIVAAYGNAVVGRDGCGGVQDGPMVYLNGSTGTLATNPSEFSLYRAWDIYPSAPESIPDNHDGLTPRVFFRDASPGRDAHGMVVTQGPVRYLWQFDRLANVAEVFRLPSLRHERTVDLRASGLSADPAADLVARSPDGRHLFLALRGPNPQTGGHAAPGSTPGLGVLALTEGGGNGEIRHIHRTSFTNPLSGGEESDPHGISVRLLSAP